MNSRKTLTHMEIITLLQQQQQYLKNFSVKKIGLFGSYAAGGQQLKSDIDFVVEFEEPSFENFMNLINYLEKLFKRKVDILTPDSVESIRIKKVAEDIKRSLVYV